MAQILIVEDEKPLRTSLVGGLQLDGHQAVGVEAVKDAREAMRTREFDAVVTDVNLPGETGLEFVRKLREEGFGGALLVMTAFGTSKPVESAVEAMRCGADDYMQKPVGLDDLNLRITRAIDVRKTKSRLKLYDRLESARSGESPVIGESAAWQRALTTARRFSSMPIPRAGETGELPCVLLLGETGVGKGVVAQYVHRADPGFNAAQPTPFVHVNCAALPPGLIESELFGHEKGAFTDAKAARIGLFELAEGGTIFLDEIGELPMDMQAKLLLVVERSVFRRIGGEKERSARARVVAATNLDLEQRVKEGRFRPDLLFRLNALTVRIPALRERGHDAVLIARATLERMAKQQGKPGLKFEAAAEAAIGAANWPGNVRELINAVKRATILCEPPVVNAEDMGLTAPSYVSMADLDPAREPHLRSTESVNGIPLLSGRLPTVDEMETMLIKQALRQAHGNVSMAAKLIGLNRGALRYRIDRLNLSSAVEEAST
ncbi:MAG: sigma-54-dependent transcriptional regulator [Phycisphaerales bacterium]